MFGVAYAQETKQSLQGILARFYEHILNPLILTLFAVALVVFFYGVIIYIRDAAKSPEALKKGRDHMIWGIVGFVIMIGVYGIINLLIGTFNIQGVTVNDKKIEVNQPEIPKLNLPNFKTK